MKNKKSLKLTTLGFTLVELLAVIVILGVILTIAIPNILNIIEKARIDAIIRNEEMLVNATKKYLVSNTNILPTNVGDTVEVTLNSLKSNQLIDSIKNPRNNNECNGYVLVTKLGNNEYDYTPQLNCVDNTKVSISSDGLIGYWKFDNGQAIDYSINKNNGMIEGATLTSNRFGNINKSLSFNGVSDYVSTNQLFNFNKTDSFSVLLWININNHSHKATAAAGIIGKGHWYDNTWDIFLYNSNAIAFEVSGNPTRNGIVNILTPILSLNRWHFYSAIYENGSIRIYLDGDLIRTATYNGIGDFNNSNNLLMAMRFNDSSRRLNGMLDDIRIYNRALTLEEIKQIYDREKYRSQ